MAHGRMISNDITSDKRINDLSDDTSRLAFTWLVTFADCEGRTHGDPAMVRSMIFPRRADVSVGMVEEYIREWDAAGPIVWYEAEGDWWIWFPAFAKRQPGLRKERETPSFIPPPPQTNSGTTPAELPTNSGTTPEQIPVKLSEEKLINDSDSYSQSPPESAPFTPPIGEKIYQKVTGQPCLPGSSLSDDLRRLEAIYGSRGRKFDETVNYLLPFFKAWIDPPWSYRKNNTNWLDWAISGEIPKRVGKGHDDNGRTSKRRAGSGSAVVEQDGSEDEIAAEIKRRNKSPG